MRKEGKEERMVKKRKRKEECSMTKLSNARRKAVNSSQDDKNDSMTHSEQRRKTGGICVGPGRWKLG